MDVQHLNNIPACITKDGSEIRELLVYRNSVIRNQSPLSLKISTHNHR